MSRRRRLAIASGLPAFIREIERLFKEDEIAAYLKLVALNRYGQPSGLNSDRMDDGDPFNDPILAASELLRFDRVRSLLTQRSAQGRIEG